MGSLPLPAEKHGAVERAANRFEGSRWLQGLFGCLNHLPLPYRWMPVRVKRHRMIAHTFDRYCALWLWRMRKLGGFESRVLARCLRPGCRAADVGANIGLTTLRMAKYAGHSGKVWAFEADRANFETLRRNIARNGYENAEAVHAAVGEKSGEAFVFKSGANAGDHRVFEAGAGRAREPVRMTALDDCFAPASRLDFVKLDIQGAEALALRGMKRLLRENRRITVMMELFPAGLRQSGCEPLEPLRTLRELGFALQWIDDEAKTLRTLAPEDDAAFAQSLEGGRYENIVARREEKCASGWPRKP